MAGERGPYRSIYCVLWDSPEFQQLPSDAKTLFMYLRTGPDCNFPCIFVFRRLGLREQFHDWPDARIDAGIDALIDASFIRVSMPLIWIVNGLRYDPSYVPANSKQKSGIEAILKSLPKCQLINECAEFYSFSFHCNGMPASMP